MHAARASPGSALLAATEIAPPHSPSREAGNSARKKLEHQPTRDGVCALRLARLDGAHKKQNERGCIFNPPLVRE